MRKSTFLYMPTVPFFKAGHYEYSGEPGDLQENAVFGMQGKGLVMMPEAGNITKLVRARDICQGLYLQLSPVKGPVLYRL